MPITEQILIYLKTLKENSDIKSLALQYLESQSRDKPEEFITSLLEIYHTQNLKQDLRTLSLTILSQFLPINTSYQTFIFLSKDFQKKLLNDLLIFYSSEEKSEFSYGLKILIINIFTSLCQNKILLEESKWNVLPERIIGFCLEHNSLYNNKYFEILKCLVYQNSIIYENIDQLEEFIQKIKMEAKETETQMELSMLILNLMEFANYSQRLILSRHFHLTFDLLMELYLDKKKLDFLLLIDQCISLSNQTPQLFIPILDKAFKIMIYQCKDFQQTECQTKLLEFFMIQLKYGTIDDMSLIFKLKHYILQKIYIEINDVYSFKADSTSLGVYKEQLNQLFKFFNMTKSSQEIEVLQYKEENLNPIQIIYQDLYVKKFFNKIEVQSLINKNNIFFILLVLKLLSENFDFLIANESSRDSVFEILSCLAQHPRRDISIEAMNIMGNFLIRLDKDLYYEYGMDVKEILIEESQCDGNPLEFRTIGLIKGLYISHSDHVQKMSSYITNILEKIQKKFEDDKVNNQFYFSFMETYLLYSNTLDENRSFKIKLWILENLKNNLFKLDKERVQKAIKLIGYIYSQYSNIRVYKSNLTEIILQQMIELIDSSIMQNDLVMIVQNFRDVSRFYYKYLQIMMIKKCSKKLSSKNPLIGLPLLITLSNINDISEDEQELLGQSIIAILKQQLEIKQIFPFYQNLEKLQIFLKNIGENCFKDSITQMMMIIHQYFIRIKDLYQMVESDKENFPFYFQTDKRIFQQGNIKIGMILASMIETQKLFSLDGFEAVYMQEIIPRWKAVEEDNQKTSYFKILVAAVEILGGYLNNQVLVQMMDYFFEGIKSNVSNNKCLGYQGLGFIAKNLQQEFLPFLEQSIKLISAQTNNVETQEDQYCKDIAISSLGLILSSIYEKLETNRKNIFLKFWLNNLPLKIYRKQKTQTYNFLFNLLFLDEKTILGENFENINKIIEILDYLYDEDDKENFELKEKIKVFCRKLGEKGQLIELIGKGRISIKNQDFLNDISFVKN